MVLLCALFYIHNMNKFLIIGLGNPGDEYTFTRHNIGFRVVDAMAQNSDATFENQRLGFVAQFRLKGRQVWLLKPTTFMNLSGKAVHYWIKKTEIPIENLLVILDDISLPTGAFRIRPNGSDGGHNGLISIIEHLETIDFPRFRFGIGNNFPKGRQSEYVLGKWTTEEETIIGQRIPLAVDAIKTFILSGINNAMNQYNKR